MCYDVALWKPNLVKTPPDVTGLAAVQVETGFHCYQRNIIQTVIMKTEVFNEMYRNHVKQHMPMTYSSIRERILPALKSFLSEFPRNQLRAIYDVRVWNSGIPLNSEFYVRRENENDGEFFIRIALYELHDELRAWDQ
jgi:hypothetical protein